MYSKLLRQGTPDRSWCSILQRQIARFRVVNLRNGELSCTIYALNRTVFHHNLLAPDLIQGLIENAGSCAGRGGKACLQMRLFVVVPCLSFCCIPWFVFGDVLEKSEAEMN